MEQVIVNLLAKFMLRADLIHAKQAVDSLFFV